MRRLAVRNVRVWHGEQNAHAIGAPDQGEACSRVLIGTSVDESEKAHELVAVHALDCFSPWTFMTAHHIGTEGGQPVRHTLHGHCAMRGWS